MTDGWDPDGDVLVVGHSLDPAVLGDIRRRLPGIEVHVVDLDEVAEADGDAEPPADDDDDAQPPADAADADAADAADAAGSLDSGFPPTSDLAVELITTRLEAAPRVTTLLAQSRWAARDIWRVVRPRPHLRGFTHLDNLERARATRLDLDVTPHGRRRNSHRFSLEFGGDEGDESLPAWDPRTHVRVLVGPANEHGVAAGWARALRGLYGVDALSLAVGDDGFPADVMATTHDWETKSVRRQVLALAAGATHILVDHPGALGGDALDTGRSGVVTASASLPIAVMPGTPPDRDDTPMQVLLVGGGEADGIPMTWRVTRLADMPRSLWVATARHADLIVDGRDPPRLDAIVLNGMVNGAVLVADGLPSGWFRKKLPHLTAVTDPLLAGESVMRRLRAASAEYVRRHHSDEIVAGKLRRALGIR